MINAISILCLAFVAISCFLYYLNRKKAKEIEQLEENHKKVAYELRTMISLMLGSVEKLEQNLPLEDQNTRALNRIRTSMGYLSSLADSILNFEKDIPPDDPDSIERVTGSQYQHDTTGQSLIAGDLRTTDTLQSAKRILVVEDDPEMLEYEAELLGEFYDVSTATNGKEALELLLKEDGQFNLVVSDVTMPEMDGFELLEAITTSDMLAAIPVIMVTARAEEHDKARALAAGVGDYIIKPFSREVLIAHCDNLLAFAENRGVPIREDVDDKKAPVPDDIRVRPVHLKWLAKLESMMIERIGDKSFNVLVMADEMALSERQFRRKLKQITGLSPIRYYNEVKLKKARQMLRSGEHETVSEISYALGFETTSYFADLYKKRFGENPSSDLL